MTGVTSYELQQQQDMESNRGQSGDHSHHGSTVSFRDVEYSVQISQKCFGGVKHKHIIKGVSGILEAGKMNAILGATGSGKTSLLDILANRKDPKWLKGTILIDGSPQPDNFKCISGYVVQEDIVMGTLTVRENMQFSANLRLPPSLGQSVINKKVDDCIEELGLSHVADSKIGNEFVRGVSGGEKKRTNIGMELVTSPTVLFLDEPTTGLDASTANAVMALLHKLSRTGRTIVFSIHQPRYSIFRLFDRMVLLSRGHMVYHGPAGEAIDHFQGLGYVCESFNNPADFFLDIINGDSTALKNMPALDMVAREEGKVSIDVNDEDESEDRIANALMKKYKESPFFETVIDQLDHEKPKELVNSRRDIYVTSFFKQFKILSVRTMRNIIRNPALSLVQIFVMLVFGIMVGLIYRDLDFEFDTGGANRFGVFFFIIMTQVFSNGTALEAFIRERVFFIHENSNGFYRVSSYFFAKVVCDIVPLRLLPVLVFSLIVYFLIGLRSGAGPFFFFVFTLLVVNITAACFGFLFGSVCRLFAQAQILMILVYVTTMMFAGFMVRLETVDWYLRWIQYISIFRYGVNALSVNEFKGITLCQLRESANNCTQEVPGTLFLDMNNIPHETLWDMWVNLFALSCICVGMIVLSYVALRLINKYK